MRNYYKNVFPLSLMSALGTLYLCKIRDLTYFTTVLASSAVAATASTLGFIINKHENISKIKRIRKMSHEINTPYMKNLTNIHIMQRHSIPSR